MTYIGLLRGINVGGHKIISMELLRKVLAELGFHNIRTYIQSGNILFDTEPTAVKELEQQISDKILEHFGFTVPAIIVTVDELKAVVRNNPYSDRELADPAQPYVAFLSGLPASEGITNLKAASFGNDEFMIVEKSIYLLYAVSAATTKLTNAAIEGKLKVHATSRNWKTILKLISLAENN